MMQRLFRHGLVVGLLLSMSAWMSHPALALVKMDNKTIEAALIYGMQNQKMGFSALLGPNWIEGTNGALLNIYSPFMVLATKSAKGGFPISPKKEDVEKAKQKYGKHVAFMRDPKNKLQVKFAVNFYGNSPDFATKYQAHIEGFGRGKEFIVTPRKEIRDKIADPMDTQGKTIYEAVNSYYFLFSDLEDLQDYKLILESPNGEPLSFRIKNDRIY